MAWPADGKVVIHSLAKGAATVKQVSLLGSKEAIAWQQTPAGLEVTLPAARPCDFAYGLKITGDDLKAGANAAAVKLGSAG